jgi:hypothetical protein
MAARFNHCLPKAIFSVSNLSFFALSLGLAFYALAAKALRTSIRKSSARIKLQETHPLKIFVFSFGF